MSIPWSPELRRAVMKSCPDYFTWSETQQDQYRMNQPDADRAVFESFLLKEIFKINSKDPRQVMESFSKEDQNRWNASTLPFYGIGEDSFFLNEYLGEGKSLLDFLTLRDYDEDNFHFQEHARKQEDPTYVGKPYYGSLYMNWARLHIDGKFTYATLSMVAGYVYAHINDMTYQILEELIPHRYVEGPGHGKHVKNGIQWDMQIDANGKENILDELKKQIWTYEQSRADALAARFDAEPAQVYILDESKTPEENMHFVFNNMHALSKIKWQSFVRDCRSLEATREPLGELLQEESVLLKEFIEVQHEEILRLHDPNIVRLPNQRKVMMTNDLFNKLG